MLANLDNDWRAKIARDYFAMTWDGPSGLGLTRGVDNLQNLYKSIEDTFHEDYIFMRENKVVLNQGVEISKKILHDLTAPLTHMKMTSFDIIAVNEEQNSVTFQSTAVANKPGVNERYSQYLKLTYMFEGDKVRTVLVHYHSNYDF